MVSSKRIPFTKPTKLHKATYGAWAGNPDGTKVDPDRCCERTYSFGVSMQCHNKRGHGPEQAYCGTHDPVRREKARKQKQDRYDEHARVIANQRNQRQRELLLEKVKPLLAGLEEIALGHNDPRPRAREAIERFDDLLAKTFPITQKDGT